MANDALKLEPKQTPAPVAGRSGDNGDGNGLRERLARLEKKVEDIKEHMAVKNDITSVKVWVLIGALTAVVSGIGIALTVALLVARAFISNPP